MIAARYWELEFGSLHIPGELQNDNGLNAFTGPRLPARPGLVSGWQGVRRLHAGLRSEDGEGDFAAPDRPKITVEISRRSPKVDHYSAGSQSLFGEPGDGFSP